MRTRSTAVEKEFVGKVMYALRLNVAEEIPLDRWESDIRRLVGEGGKYYGFMEKHVRTVSVPQEVDADGWTEGEHWCYGVLLRFGEEVKTDDVKNMIFSQDTTWNTVEKPKDTEDTEKWMKQMARRVRRRRLATRIGGWNRMFSSS
jgi:hypothetical protein